MKQRKIPEGYTLSRTFHNMYNSVEIWTDGSYFIFADKYDDDEMGWFYQTISDPVKIGNGG